MTGWDILEGVVAAAENMRAPIILSASKSYPGTANIKSLARAVIHPADVLGSRRLLAEQGRKMACWAWAREWVRHLRWFCVHAHACPGLTHTRACFMALVLVLVSAKMLVAHWYKVPIGLALGVVGIILLSSVLASLMAMRNGKKGDTAS